MLSRLLSANLFATVAVAVTLLLGARTPASASPSAGGAPSGAVGAASFEGLGDLPGGDFFCYVSAVSGDGTTAVGRSRSRTSTASYEAFVWNESTGMTGLGDLLPGDPKSHAHDVSFDGSVVAGDARGANGTVTRAARMTRRRATAARSRSASHLRTRSAIGSRSRFWETRSTQPCRRRACGSICSAPTGGSSARSRTASP